MKEIQPFNIWVSGQMKSAKFMSLVCGTDNLVDSAMFYYCLFEGTLDSKGVLVASNKIADGNITMTGAPYSSWQTNPQAWAWAGQTLGITYK